MSEDWIRDCIRHYGKVLTGRKAHWCPEWDYLPIDENSFEYDCCLCYKRKDPLTKGGL